MVVLLINKFFFEKGGAERYFFLLSDELQARGHDVVHFSMQHTNNRPSPYSEYFVSRREYDVPKGPFRSLTEGLSFIRSREAARNIKKLIDKYRPRIAHIHNIYHQITPSVIPVLEAAGIPMVMTIHDYKLVCPNYSLFAAGEYCYRCKNGKFYQAVLTNCSGSLSRGALLAAEAYRQRSSGVYKAIRRFVAPSRYMRNKITAAGFEKDRVRYVPGFIPPRPFGENPELTEDERIVLENLPRSYVLYFGRLSPEKGLLTLIEAAQKLPEIQFVICGDGPQAGRLAAEVDDRALNNVFFTGYANKPLLEQMVGRARISVLPTLSPENAPFTVLESAAAGLPLIVSDMGGLPEMAGVLGGEVFKHADAGDLAAKIAALWKDPEAARLRGDAGRKAALEYFDRTRHMDAIEGIYGELVV